MALAATEPDRAAREIEALERAMPGEGGLPASLLAEARAQTFIRLVNAGAYAAAERLAPGVARQIEAQDSDEIRGAETLDSLYCLGMLALHRERPEDAAELFGRVHRLAGERAEILWSARLHEGLSLQRAGREEPARAAFAAIAEAAEVAEVPFPLAEAARSFLAAGRG